MGAIKGTIGVIATGVGFVLGSVYDAICRWISRSKESYEIKVPLEEVCPLLGWYNFRSDCFN